MGLRKISDPFCAHRDIQREVSSVVIAPYVAWKSLGYSRHAWKNIGMVFAWCIDWKKTSISHLDFVPCVLLADWTSSRNNEKCITAPKPSPPTQPKHEYLAEQARGIQRSEGVSVVYSGVVLTKSGLVRSGPQGRSDVVVLLRWLW